MFRVVVFVLISMTLMSFSAMGEESAANPAIDHFAYQVEVCASKLDDYLVKRLGDYVVNKEKNGLLKVMYDRCGEFVPADKNLEAAVDDDVEQPQQPVQREKAVAVEVDADRVDAELARLGLLVSGSHSVVIFASEIIEKDWIESFFTSPSALQNGEISLNECENLVNIEMAWRGFTSRASPLNKTERMQARSFRTVVGRYRDLSSMPNFTSARAAAIIDKGASVVVGCRVLVDVEDRGENGDYNSCASGKCKAVDMRSKERVATASGSKCSTNADSTTAGIAAIRGICEEMGRSLGTGMVKLYSTSGGEQGR